MTISSVAPAVHAGRPRPPARAAGGARRAVRRHPRRRRCRVAELPALRGPLRLPSRPQTPDGSSDGDGPALVPGPRPRRSTTEAADRRPGSADRSSARRRSWRPPRSCRSPRCSPPPPCRLSPVVRRRSPGRPAQPSPSYRRGRRRCRGSPTTERRSCDRDRAARRQSRGSGRRRPPTPRAESSASSAPGRRAGRRPKPRRAEDPTLRPSGGARRGTPTAGTCRPRRQPGTGRCRATATPQTTGRDPRPRRGHRGPATTAPAHATGRRRSRTTAQTSAAAGLQAAGTRGRAPATPLPRAPASRDRPSPATSPARSSPRSAGWSAAATAPGGSPSSSRPRRSATSGCRSPSATATCRSGWSAASRPSRRSAPAPRSCSGCSTCAGASSSQIVVGDQGTVAPTPALGSTAPGDRPPAGPPDHRTAGTRDGDTSARDGSPRGTAAAVLHRPDRHSWRAHAHPPGCRRDDVRRTVDGIRSRGDTRTLRAGTRTATERRPARRTALDKDMFLQLLVAQMRNQDPANPTDSSEFLAQTAQFTALEKMQQVADQTSQLVALQVAFGASSMVGRTVAYAGPDGDDAVRRRQLGALRGHRPRPPGQRRGRALRRGPVRRRRHHRPHRASPATRRRDRPPYTASDLPAPRPSTTSHVPEGNHHASFTLLRHQRPPRQPDDARRDRQQHRQRQHGRLQGQHAPSSRTP